MSRLIIRNPDPIGPVGSWGFKKFNPKKMFAIDTETTGLDNWGKMGVDREFEPCRPFMFTLCDENGNMATIRWLIDPYTRGVITDKKTFKLLQKFLLNKKLAKIFHNWSFDIKMLRAAGFIVVGPFHDTQIRMHILKPDERSWGLKPLCDKYFDIDDGDQKDLISSVNSARISAKRLGYAIADSNKADYWLGKPKLCRKYGELDAYRTMILFLSQEEMFEEYPKRLDVYKRELKLMHAIDRMECRGVRLDVDRIEEIKEYYEKVIVKSKKKIVKAAGKEFNPNSYPQKTKLFFGKLGHTPLEYSSKGKGRAKTYTDCSHCKGEGCKVCQDTGRNPKCDGKFLESISVVRDDEDNIKVKDKLAYAMLENSAASTMLGYLNSYIKFSVKDKNGDTILHPNYKQCGPITGRLAAERPNLQNVASDESGSKKTNIDYRLREAFIARKDHVLYIPDYSQIEVWIMALQSGDNKLIDQLAQGGDAHQLVADLIWPDAYSKKIAKRAGDKKAKDRSTKELKHLKEKGRIRKRIKTINFGIIYGQGADATAAGIGCSMEEVTEYLRQYHKKLPAVKKFMQDSIDEAREQGYVVNPYGRYYPISKSRIYVATNYKVQGTAAEVLKNAIIHVDKLSQKKKYMDLMRLLLNIHDELMAEIHKSIHNKKTQQDIVDAMNTDAEFLGCPIPFPIGLKIAEHRWTEYMEVTL